MIDNLRRLFKKYTEQLDARSLRERGIIFLAIMIGLYSVAANLVFPPLYREQDQLRKQLATKRGQVQAFESQIQAALTKSAQDPDAANRAKLAALEGRLKALDATLVDVTTRLVPPNEMARLVESILARNRRLELVKIENLASEALQPVTPSGKKGAAAVMVYRHGLRIELKGSYHDLLAYLRELEALPWKMFWGQITLQTEEYPVARVVLRIYTLSTKESWLTI